MTYHASEINIRLKRKVSRSGRISGLFDYEGFQPFFYAFSGHHIVRLSGRLVLARHEPFVNPGSK